MSGKLDVVLLQNVLGLVGYPYVFRKIEALEWLRIRTYHGDHT